MRDSAQIFLMVLILTTIVACAPTSWRPNLATIYNDLAQREDLDRNPIIVIPGVMGSRLVEDKSGTVVWGAFGTGQVNPGTPQGARLVALPIQADTGQAAVNGSLRADGALDRYVVRLFGLPMELDAYYQILSALGVGGYRDQGLGEAGAIDYGDRHFTCFQFAYDWRRDIVANAQALDQFIQAKAEYVKTEIKRRYGIDKSSIRFDIVAHSMGGLVARYYLRYGGDRLPSDGPIPIPTWKGAEQVENLIMIGTPNGGSLDSFVNLIEGYRPSFLLARYPAAVLGTFPSIYQMLPRGRHMTLLDTDGQPIQDLFEPELWKQQKWGLADPDQAKYISAFLPHVADQAERHAIALAYQRRTLNSARRFAEVMDLPAKPPASLRLMLVAGDAVPTKQTMRIMSNGRLETVAKGPGDGVVLRRSALLDERQGDAALGRLVSPIGWYQSLFLFSDHLGLTKDPVFTDNVLHFLLEYPSP